MNVYSAMSHDLTSANILGRPSITSPSHIDCDSNSLMLNVQPNCKIIGKVWYLHKGREEYGITGMECCIRNTTNKDCSVTIAILGSYSVPMVYSYSRLESSIFGRSF